jgi:tetratricopeptide (TPR) repeat protein
MIVKDEAERLPRCLASVRDFVDEIVVVDTGSSDRTPEIAREFGARVFFHPWEDDFSKHRNQSLTYAGGLWFMYLDADEEIVDGTGHLIRRASRDEDVDSISFEFISTYAGGKRSLHTQARLFRNDRGIHFEGRIHNRVVGVRSTRLYPIRVVHYGYDLGYERAREKHERRLRILKREIEEDPLNPIHHHYLAVAHFSAPDYDLAAGESMLALEQAERSGAAGSFFYAWTHFVAASSLYHLGRLDEARRICHLGLERFPNDPDLHFMACHIAFDGNDHEDLKDHASVYLSIRGGPARNLVSQGMIHWTTYDKEWEIHWLMAMSHRKQEDLNGYEAAMARALAVAPQKADVYLASSRFHVRSGDYPLAKAELEKVFQCRPRNEDILFSGIEMAIRMKDEPMEIHGWKELLHQFPEKKELMILQADKALDEQRLSEARKLLTALISRHPDEKEILDRWLRLGALFLRAGDCEQSRQALERVLACMPAEPSALLTMAIIEWRSGRTDSLANLLDRILRRFGIPQDREIGSLEELGALFFLLGEEFLKRGHAETAILSCGTALDMNFTLPRVHQTLALAFKQEGRLEDSLEHLRSALLSSENSKPLLLEMADIYRRMGNVRAAEFCLEKSATLPN